jgi:hypothetical protein
VCQIASDKGEEVRREKGNQEQGNWAERQYLQETRKETQKVIISYKAQLKRFIHPPGNCCDDGRSVCGWYESDSVWGVIDTDGRYAPEFYERATTGSFGVYIWRYRPQGNLD